MVTKSVGGVLLTMTFVLAGSAACGGSGSNSADGQSGGGIGAGGIGAGGVGSSSGGAASTGGAPVFDPDKVVCVTQKIFTDARSQCTCTRAGGLSSDTTWPCNSDVFGGSRCTTSVDHCMCERYTCGESITEGGPKTGSCRCGFGVYFQDLTSCPTGYAHYCYDPTTTICQGQPDPCATGQEELPSCDAAVVLPKANASAGHTLDCVGYTESLPPLPPPPVGTGGAPNSCKRLLETCDPMASTSTAGDCCFGTIYSLFCSATQGCVKRNSEPCTTDAECFSEACISGTCDFQPPPCDPGSCSGCQYFGADACCYSCSGSECKQSCSF